AADHFDEGKQILEKSERLPPLRRQVISVCQRVPRNRAVDSPRLATVEHASRISQKLFPTGHHIQQHIAIQQDFHEYFLASCVPRRSDGLGARKATLPAHRSENGFPLRT